jgi:hypothetical protein
VVTSEGEHIDTQYLLACCGMLSAPLNERFPGHLQGVSSGSEGIGGASLVDQLFSKIIAASKRGRLEDREPAQSEMLLHAADQILTVL